MGNTQRTEYTNEMVNKYSEVNKSTTVDNQTNDHQKYTQHDKDIGNKIGGNMENVDGFVNKGGNV